MQLSDAFLAQGEPAFNQLVRTVSMGKLRTFQLYERVKARAHLHKLNTETLQKAAPRLWSRLNERDEELAQDLAQAILVSNLDMITAVLDFLRIPHQDGFFEKGLDAKPYLTEGWQQRVYGQFRNQYPEPLLQFYINHLASELVEAAEPFVPAA